VGRPAPHNRAQDAPAPNGEGIGEDAVLLLCSNSHAGRGLHRRNAAAPCQDSRIPAITRGGPPRRAVVVRGLPGPRHDHRPRPHVRKDGAVRRRGARHHVVQFGGARDYASVLRKHQPPRRHLFRHLLRHRLTGRALRNKKGEAAARKSPSALATHSAMTSFIEQPSRIQRIANQRVALFIAAARVVGFARDYVR